MPSVDRGKEFESIFSSICEQNGIGCVRFYDATQHFKGVDNPADFVISKSFTSPSILVECKSIHGTSFGFDFRQRESLEKLGKYFFAVVLVWFVNRKEVWSLTLESIHELEEKTKMKSFNPDNLEKFKNKYNLFNCPVRIDTEFARIRPKNLDLKEILI